VRDERPPLRHPGQPRLDLLTRAEAQLTVGDLDLDPGRTQLVEPARGRRIRISRSGENLCDPRVDHRLRARRGRAPARARLEGDVERRRAGAVAGGRERVRLGMRLALPLVPALADDLV